MRPALPFLLLLAALPAVAGAEDHVPFIGIEGLDAYQAADREAGRLEKLAGPGACYVRTASIPWGRIQPAPARRGPPVYRWEGIDEAILLWQLSGFEPVPVLSPRSPWASMDAAKTEWHRRVGKALSGPEGKAALLAATGCAPPGGDAWLRWERFVRAFVERYDGDGKDDMPGLRRPVRHFQILERVGMPDAWLGSADEYLRLLHHAGLGAKSADATARIVAAALDLRGTGHDPYPDTREWDYRIGFLVPAAAPLAELEIKGAFEVARRVLESSRLYDIATHAGNDNHADDVANLRFVRRYLDEHGGQDVGLWLVDNPTRKLGLARSPSTVKPRAEELRLQRRWRHPALNPAHSEHAKALAWLRRGQALDLVRSVCRARAAGADVVCLQAAWDTLPETHRERRERARQGLVARVEDGPPADALKRTPSWYALAQAVGLLGGHRSAGESALGAPGRAVVFTFDDKSARPWISVLLLDPRLSWAGVPGEALPKRAVAVPLPNGAYVLESCRLDAAEPARREVTVTEGMLELELTPAPVYVIPTK